MNILTQEDIYSNPLINKPTGKLKAFCNSFNCFPRRSKNDNTTLGKEKFVSKHTICCNDCGSALYWTKESEIYKFKDKK